MGVVSIGEIPKGELKLKIQASTAVLPGMTLSSLFRAR